TMVSHVWDVSFDVFQACPDFACSDAVGQNLTEKVCYILIPQDTQGLLVRQGPSPRRRLDLRSSTPSHALTTPTLPSPSSAPTTSAKTLVLSDNDFEKTFQGILERWRFKSLTQNDRSHLLNTPISLDEYEVVTDQFRLKHGIELRDGRIYMNECPTRVHECVSRHFDYLTQTC